MIITIGSQKGGVGTSTVAINLALGIASLSKKIDVALVDADAQKSCIETLQNHKRKNLTLYEAQEKPHRLIESLSQKIIIVDTPPHSHETMYQAAAVSDVVIIPLQPSPLDIRSIAITVKALTVIQKKINPHLQCHFLINRITHRTILSSEIRPVLKQRYPFQIFETMLHNREAYKQSLITGLSVLEYDKKSEAAKEMQMFLMEIIKAFKLKKLKA